MKRIRRHKKAFRQAYKKVMDRYPYEVCDIGVAEELFVEGAIYGLMDGAAEVCKLNMREWYSKGYNNGADDAEAKWKRTSNEPEVTSNRLRLINTMRKVRRLNVRE